MNDPVSTSHSSTRRNKSLILFGGIAFGAVCFFVGRLSVRQGAPGTAPINPGDSTPAETSANPSVSKPGAASVAESQTQASPAPPPSGWGEHQWQQLLSQPGTPARNATLADLLEKLAAVDPTRAMTVAQAEGNLKLREALVQASLRGWARSSPTNAANWALALPDSNDRERALSTVFAGAVAANPDGAVRLGLSLFRNNPDQARGCGSSLITALGDAGDFETAAHMAANGDEQTRSGWMAGAYSQWAEFQPEQASKAAAAIEDPDLRNQALHGIIGGWAEADPATLVQFVMQLPPDAERGSLLSQSLERWVKHDPEAASQWINNHETGPDTDQGAAAVATMDSLKPDLAVSWAVSVVNPKLRSETLVTVLRNWVTVDLPAAERYFQTTKDLLPEDRQEIAGVIATLKGQSASQ
jgi:hypothetical protein